MPWFLWALFAVVAVLGLVALLPKPDIEGARPSKLGDMQFPRANEGDPIPIIYGRVKVRSPNTLWYGDFITERITEKVKTGLFSSKRVTTGYRYYVGMALGLCLGENVKLTRIWAGTTLIWGIKADGSAVRDLSGESGFLHGEGTWPSGRLVEYPTSPLVTRVVAGDDDAEQAQGIDTSVIDGYKQVPAGSGYEFYVKAGEIFGGAKKQGGMAGPACFYSGENDQLVDAYLSQHTDGVDTSSLPKLCYLVLKRFYVGTSTQLKALSFELERYSNALLIPDGKHKIGDDMNPMEVLYDILTNPFARRGISANLIDTDSFRAAAVTLHSEGNGMSLKLEQPNQAKEVVSEILRQVDGIMFQNPATGKIQVKLIRQDYDLVTLPRLTENEIEDITDFTKTMWGETVNQVRVKFLSRDQGYTARPVIEQDMANIAFQNQVRSAEVEFPGVYKSGLAQKLARRELAAMSVPMFKCDVIVNRKAQILKPGDAFKLNWPDLNLIDAVMRVTQYNLGTLEDGRISFQAVQDKFASLTTAFQPPQNSGWVPIDNSAVNVGNPRLLFAPRWFVNQLDGASWDEPYYFALANAGNGAQVSYDVRFTQGENVFMPLDDVTFTPGGLTTADMPNDAVTIASLGVTAMDETFSSATDAKIKQGVNLALIENEIIGFRSATDTTMTTIYRGLLGTSPALHVAGSRIYFLDELQALSPTPAEVGVSLSAEFLSEAASNAQSSGVTVTTTPPAAYAGEAQANSLAITNEVNNTFPPGVQTVSWAHTGRKDTSILLPGDPVPGVPNGTTTRLIITEFSSTVVDTTLAEGVTQYSGYNFIVGRPYKFEAIPMVNGVRGLSQVRNLTCS